MKKLILLLITLSFLVVSADANYYGVIARKNAVSAFCDSYPDAANGADVLCEDFEPTGYGETWVETLNGGTIDEDNTPTGTWTCTETDTKNVSLVASGATRTIGDFGSEVAHSYGLFYFKVLAESVPNSNNTAILYPIYDGAGYAGIIRLDQDGSGNLSLSIGQRTDADGTDYKSVGSSVYLTVGDEIRVQWDHDSTTGSGTSTWKVRIEGESEETVTFTENETDDGHGFRYFIVGDVIDNDNFTIEVNNIRVDDDTAPPLCNGDS